VDTGIFFITTNQKIERNKRYLKIKSKSYRIECMNNSEINNYKTIWKETGIKKQENLINFDGNKKINNQQEIVEDDYTLLHKSKKKEKEKTSDVDKVIEKDNIKGSNKKEQVFREADNTSLKSAKTSSDEDKNLSKGKNLQKEKENSDKNNNTLNTLNSPLKKNYVHIENDDSVPKLGISISTKKTERNNSPKKKKKL